MFVVFIHGPAASGKHTIGSRLAATTELPLFHNHLTVDLVKSLFEFGSAPFAELRAAIWRASFTAATRAGRSFIFTFHPEASVDPALYDTLERGGAFRFPPLPEPLLRLDTERLSADESASRIAEALRGVEEEVAR